MLFGELSDSESFLFHYTSPKVLAEILESRSVRLSSYLRTNDPLESQTWQVMLERDGFNRGFDWPQLTADIRDRVKIACFTLDSGNPDGQTSFLLDRGWARARMWQQYGSAHTGACLILDKRAVDDEFTMLRARQGLYGRHGEVRYSDQPFGLGTLVLSADALDDQGEDQVIQAFVEEKCEVLFFKKNLDWQSENEYRYLVTSDREFEELPAASTLAGIVVGQGFPLAELRVLANRLERLGRSDLPIARLNWVDGRPDSRVDPSNMSIALESLDLRDT